MSFHDVRLDDRIAYGSEGGPGFLTYVTSVDSGQEERVARLEQGRSRYDLATGLKKQEDVHTLLTFYRARMGAAYAFRMKDWADYATSASGVTYGSPDGELLDAVSHDDSVIGTGDGATTQFQLVKQYTSGPVTRNRTITKPVSSTVKVGLDGVNQTTGWTVNTATGVVTFDAAPGVGVVVSAGFEFDVPVRFSEEIDKQLPIRLEAYRSGSTSIPVVEVLGEGEASDEFFYGGAVEVASASDLTISGITRVWVVNMTASGKSVILPALATSTPGGPVFYVVNDGANAFALKTASLTNLVASISPGQGVEVFISRDNLGTMVWYAK